MASNVASLREARESHLRSDVLTRLESVVRDVAVILHEFRVLEAEKHALTASAEALRAEVYQLRQRLEDDWMSHKDAAKWLNITPRTLQNMRSAGRGPKPEYRGSTPGYRRAEIDKYNARMTGGLND